MPLRIELAPNERLILGDVSIRNGARRCELIVETRTRVLRAADIITEREADTPCKRLYLALEEGYLSAEPFGAEARFMTLANEIMAAVPSTAPMIADVFERVLEGDYYKALKRAKRLVAFEARLLALAAEAEQADGEAEPRRAVTR